MTHDGRRDANARGVTLIELLVTISIVAVLLMGGVGVYWRMNRGFALRAATSSIESALRAARAFAVHERGPASVVAEPRAANGALVARVYALGKRTVSCWHFETQDFGGDVRGALDQKGVLSGSAFYAPGRVGTALRLDRATSDSVAVTSPYLDGLREGLFVDAYVYPVNPTASPLADGDLLPVACKRNAQNVAFSLALRYHAASRCFALEGSALIENSSATSTLDTATDTAVLRSEEWTHVALSYYRDRSATGNDIALVTLRVDGQEVARTEEALVGSGVLTPHVGTLYIGTDQTASFNGRIDELKIAGLVAGEVFELPENTDATVDPGGSSDGRIHFDTEGKLDVHFHDKPALFRIISASDRILRVVRVDWLGCVEVFQNEPPSGS